MQVFNVTKTSECPACAEPSGIPVDWNMLGTEGLKCVACGAALEVQHERSCVAWPGDESPGGESHITGPAINDAGETATLNENRPG